MKKLALLSASGAVIGSLARYLIGIEIPYSESATLPWAILLVNVIGAFAIGIIASTPRVMNDEARRHFLVTGLLGGFTTYSAFAVDLVNMNVAHASIYLAATFIAGVAATHLGSVVVKK